MEVILTILEYGIGIPLMLLVSLITGPLFIYECYVTGTAKGGCGAADIALIEYGLLFAFFVIVGVRDALHSDKLFGWFFSGSHPATDIVRRSSRDAAEEFARVLEAQHFDDLRARELFGQLGPIRRRIWKARYEGRRKAAQQLREMLEAQTAAMRADADLGVGVLERERAYRARRDR